MHKATRALPSAAQGVNNLLEFNSCRGEVMPNSSRPLSPHLQVYRWKLHMALSILHRATGVALGVGTLLLTWWVFALAQGAEAYQDFQNFIYHPVGRLVLFGFTLALIFHALNGVRHLFWDIGKGFELAVVKRSGVLVVVLSLTLTVAVWVYAYIQMGKM